MILVLVIAFIFIVGVVGLAVVALVAAAVLVIRAAPRRRPAVSLELLERGPVQVTNGPPTAVSLVNGRRRPTSMKTSSQTGPADT